MTKFYIGTFFPFSALCSLISLTFFRRSPLLTIRLYTPGLSVCPCVYASVLLLLLLLLLLRDW